MNIYLICIVLFFLSNFIGVILRVVAGKVEKGINRYGWTRDSKLIHSILKEKHASLSFSITFCDFITMVTVIVIVAKIVIAVAKAFNL